MTKPFSADHDPQLNARVTGHQEMCYADGPSDDDDRPAFVLAASGLSGFREYLAVIQDDANWLALIDADENILSVPLPAGPDGKRVFTKSRGNQQHKLDFEACITVPGEAGGMELIAFSSGSSAGREWILRVSEDGRDADSGSPLDNLEARFLRAEPLYALLRGNADFCGAGLNIEGAVTLDEERIVLFQRGNAEAHDGQEPVDATAELRWSELRAYLADPAEAAPPPLRAIRRYRLGELNGVRLTFSDAEHLGEGRILFSASAEDDKEGDGQVAGSVLGVLEPDGQGRWARLCDQDGGPFKRKIEGLTLDLKDRRKVRFVVDDDDDTAPSCIFHAELDEGFLTPRHAQ